jgi:DNA polymerase I-like protein with 3'-5' exonuclease and polymerase domains
MEGRHPDDLTPEEMEDLENYALEDSRVCLQFWLDYHEAWPEHERKLSEHTTLMAHRGIELDLQKCAEAKDVFTRRLHEIRQTIPWANETTGVRVKKPVPLLSTKRLNQLCNSRDVIPPPSLRKDNDSLEMWKDHAPDDIVSIVEAFQDYKSVNRTLEVVKSAEARRIGTRCFPTLIYHEAGTGRWAGGSGLNMQNLTTRLIAGVNLRNIFTAKPGHVLLVCDLSQIEPRLLLWDVGDIDQLNMIREGMDPYEAHARATMKYSDPRPLKDVDNRLRKLAKARVLGLGYGLGAATFVTVARTNGLDLTYAEAQNEVAAYRRSNDRISSYWYSTDRDFKKSAGEDYFMHLASGRVIAYRNVSYNKEGYYQAETQLGRPKPFYGGKLVQNRTQAHGRDVLGPMILEAEARVGHVVNHVHDEIAVEVPIEQVEEKKAELEVIMRTPPSWAPDLPLDCECQVLTHFDK